jgi:hypothetical protein
VAQGYATIVFRALARDFNFIDCFIGEITDDI